MLMAVAADSAGNRIAVLLSGIIMVVVGVPLVTNYRGSVTRLTINAIERAARMRASLRMRNQGAFKERWTERQIVFTRVWGAIAVCMGTIFIVFAIFFPA